MLIWRDEIKKRMLSLLLCCLLLFLPGLSGFAEGEPTPEPEPTVVLCVALTGVAAPTLDALPETDSLQCETEGALLETAIWEMQTDEGWMPVTSAFTFGIEYRLSLTLQPQEGFAFSEDLTVTLNGETVDAAFDEDGALLLTVMFAALEEPLYRVRVTDGLASIDGVVVTKARADDVITLRASILQEGMEFECWAVTQGDVKLGSETAFMTSFRMPAQDVEIQAVFHEKPDENVCAYCGKPHSGFFGRILQFFHTILQYFRDLRG